MTYTFVIPAYNESVRLGPTLHALLRYTQEQNWDAEILVVDDGSTDDTAEIVREASRAHEQIRLVQNPGNRGKGYSVRNGMLHARGDICLFTDADLSSPMSEAQKLFDAIAQGADVAIGSRWLRVELQTERQPLYRQAFGRIFNLALRAILGLRFADTQCGFKAFRLDVSRPIIEAARIVGFAFDVELLYLAHQSGLRLREVPVRWDHHEGSKVHFVHDSLRMLREVIAIRSRAKTAVIPSEGEGPRKSSKAS
jgi:glycosyltransferase involved in cell wall biosynthesis